MASADRFEVLGQLAEGGVCEILLARRGRELVALKRPRAAAGPAAIDALREEVAVLTRVDHPNVRRVHGLAQHDGVPVAVLAPLEGLPFTALFDGGPGDPRALAALFAQLCDGLAALHALPAVHRDVSPANLFLTERGVAVLLDLGRAGTGKPAYLALEQRSDGPVDGRADLFALGLSLYDLARGLRAPDDRQGAFAGEALALDGIAAPLAGVIARATRVPLEERYPDAGAMARALRDAAGALGGALGTDQLAAWLADRHRPALEGTRRRRRELLALAPRAGWRRLAWAGLAALAVALVVYVGALVYIKAGHAPFFLVRGGGYQPFVEQIERAGRPD